jgi:hypothetical protein
MTVLQTPPGQSLAAEQAWPSFDPPVQSGREQSMTVGWTTTVSLPAVSVPVIVPEQFVPTIVTVANPTICVLPVIALEHAA